MHEKLVTEDIANIIVALNYFIDTREGIDSDYLASYQSTLSKFTESPNRG